MNQIPVIDLFAGPGGLAEGFASFEHGGRKPFKVVLSIEKDPRAHETLLLRGFYRQFAGSIPPEYWSHLRGEVSREELFSAFPHEFRRAQKECVCHELGPATDLQTRSLVREALSRTDGPWGLIGGPPCQAYSLAGRSRNRGIKGYVPERDHRQTLYLEYLQILADHRPTFFIMENVKGLLSATLASEQLFERILADLQDPGAALTRENRRASRSGPKYEVFSISRPSSGLFGPRPEDVVVRAEEHGLPQARHRVILLGLASDAPVRNVEALKRRSPMTVAAALRGLPPLRSGITDRCDDDAVWQDFVSGMGSHAWVSRLDDDVRDCVREEASRVHRIRQGRGGEFVASSRSANQNLRGFVNHATRAHITADLERYFFAACYAKTRKKSPTLADFPRDLLPNHANATGALDGGAFADRFRVQVAHRPSTTITSHISKDGHYYIHPDPLQCRSLTVREAARLQTFPDDYLFCGPRTAQYSQVGNAVPPALASQIAAVVQRLV